MQLAPFLWLILPFLPSQAPARSLSLPADRGVLRILSNGQLIGTERFEIEATGDGYRTQGEIKLKMPGGEASETSTLSLNRNLEVISYTRIQKSPKRGMVQVQFASGQAHAHYSTPQGESDYEYYLEPQVVVLDTNFFHHFAVFVQRYDLQKRGAQHVSVFIPQEASPGMMLVEYAGKDEGHDKWVAKTDALEIHIWCDEARRLVRLAVPSAKVEIVRETKQGK